MNWTVEHDDHSPFGSDEHLQSTEFYSFVITLFFFLLGLLGNGLIVIVNLYILRYSLEGKKRTLENFLLEMAFFDFLVLLYHLINAIIRYRATPDDQLSETLTGLINISAVSCKLLTYIVRISTLMSHWLMVLLLLNRLFLVYSRFSRLITVINAKYAVLALLFVFTLFNVPPIESISYNGPLLPSSVNITLSGHCLLNAEMLDLHGSVHSSWVMINVFFYTGVGLLLPTLLLVVLSTLLVRKGSHVWREVHRAERISLRSDSPLAEYLRTYQAVFLLGLIFVLLSLPSKCLRLVILFASNHLEHRSSREILVHAHAHLQTVGQALELAICSYKCLVCLTMHHRFRCAMKYLFTSEVRRVDEVRPLDVLYRQLQITDSESPIQIYRTRTETGLVSQRSSLKTRSSVISRRAKEDEISL